MIQIKVLAVGKENEGWLKSAIEEYQKRLKPQLALFFVFLKNDRQLLSALEKEKGCIALDPQGKQMVSEEFAEWAARQWEQGGSRLTFVIGGAEGLPEKVKRECLMISLSPMTFTHQLARLLLVEQLYRSLAILSNLPYHK